jgi:hypothetical protein
MINWGIFKRHFWGELLRHQQVEKRGAKNELKPANLYQGCIFAWNAHREGKTIQTIRFDAKKGLYDVHE